MSRKTEYYPFRGGLDLETPALSIDRGALIGCQNYECDIQGGYRRIDGYERFDGHNLASEATYHTVDFNNGTTEPQVGAVVTGSGSMATGYVLDVVVESGNWSTNDAAGYLVLNVIQGSFVAGDDLNIYSPEAFSSGFSSGFA